jgi:DNA polymerase-1
MQNIPERARYIYVPSYSDWCFVEADFSGIENRLAAWYANDTDRLRRLSVPGFSEHKWLCNQIFGIPENEVDKKSDEYCRAKHTNHGADAGMGPRKMSIQYNIPEKDCKDLLLMWKKLNEKSVQWQERVGNTAVQKGILTNAFGRKRWFWSQTAYTEGIRFILQGTGADICFRTMIGLYYERIQWPIELALKVCPILAPIPYPARLVLQVHDSLLFECPYNLREAVMTCMRTVMEQPWKELAGYAIPVDIKAGEPGMSWGELKLQEV